MQLIKNVVRTIGEPGSAPGVVSTEEVELHLAGLAKEGYELYSTHYLGPIKDEKGTEVGYRVLYILVSEG